MSRADSAIAWRLRSHAHRAIALALIAASGCSVPPVGVDAGPHDAASGEPDAGACTRGAESSAAECDDGCDNDGDGAADCADVSCARLQSCATDAGMVVQDAGSGCDLGSESSAVACVDACDNDGDGLVDCADGDCAGVAVCPPSCASGAESTATLCADACDNDGDGHVDCADTGCAGVGSCPPSCASGTESTATLCADACDNDGDGHVDCADTGCAGVGSCPPPPECVPGETRCAGTAGIETCTSTGQWPPFASSCSYGCNTLGGAHCNYCEPNTRYCDASDNAIVCGADGRSSTMTCTRGCADGECLDPRTLTIVNDLRDTAYGGDDWSQLNEIIHVRIASSESAVLGGSGEQLGYMDWINPGGSSCSGFTCTETFDTESMGTDYWVFIQTGWWEYFGGWTQHESTVICCSCADLCEKWVTIHISGHMGGENVIRASNFLPQMSWCGSSFC